MPRAPPGQCTQGWVSGIPVARLCSTLCSPGPLCPHSREAQSQWVHRHHFPCTSVSPWHQFPTVPQRCRWAQQGVMAATSWILHHTISSLPPCWAPLGAEHSDKAVNCHGWPKLGQPAQESAAFRALLWECMWEICVWEIPGELESLPGLFVSNSLQALLQWQRLWQRLPESKEWNRGTACFCRERTKWPPSANFPTWEEIHLTEAEWL